MRRQSVRDIRNDLTWEAFLHVIVHKVESDGVGSMSNDSPVAVVPAIAASMKRIKASIVVELGVISLAVDAESAIFNAVCVTSWHAVQVRVQSRLRIVGLQRRSGQSL